MGAPSFAALRPLERSRLYEDLVDRLRELVRESGMVAGARFPAERDLSHQLGVSRTSVRQAMVVLEAQGSVVVRHGEGVFLRRTRGFGESLPKLLELRRRLPEILEAREAIEVKLAELAAVRRTDADLAAIRTALTRMGEDIAAGGLGIDGDAMFHHAIARAARSKVLEHLIGEMAEAIQESRLESLSEPGRPPLSLEAHRNIVDAIQAGRAAESARAMRAHLRVVADVALLRWDPDVPGGRSRPGR
ncbi:MAG: FadR/GntR family transcriptional regulator [Candidatus Dormibacteraceae bacterium]